MPVILFPPVIEYYDTDEDKFIETREFNENSSNIPWLTGMNSEENLLELAAILENATFYNELIQKFNDILPYAFFYYDIGEREQEEVTKAINKFYFNSDTPSNRDRQDLINVKFLEL